MTLLTPDEYMALLVERARAEDERIGATPWARTLPEMMVRDGDETIVDMAAIEDAVARWERAASSGPKRARTYRPAAHWREQLARVESELAREVSSDRPADRAAYTGIGIRETPRQTARRHSAMDRSIERTAHLMARREALRGKLARAEAREGGVA